MSKLRPSDAGSRKGAPRSVEVLRPLRRAHPYEPYVGAKVITLATLLRRSVAVRHQRMFGMAMVETRAVLRIGASGPLSLDQLADHIAISKSQTSRIVTSLVERGLVRRDRDPSSGRGVAITLTEEGQGMEQQLIEVGAARNQELTGGLDPAQLAQMSELLDEMIARARGLLQQDQGQAGRDVVDEVADDE